MHDLEFDLPRSLKVEDKGAIRKPRYDFLLVNNYYYILICVGSWVSSFKLGDMLGTNKGFILAEK